MLCCGKKVRHLQLSTRREEYMYHTLPLFGKNFWNHQKPKSYRSSSHKYKMHVVCAPVGLGQKRMTNCKYAAFTREEG